MTNLPHDSRKECPLSIVILSEAKNHYAERNG
jgi:hypothetical protein